MGKLLSGTTLLLACVTVYAQAKETAAASASSDTEVVIWVLSGVCIFFVLVGYFTWRLIAGERKRQPDNEPPE
jgi:heme/copper-type cytochrome/quinol oxidase subunit 2